MCEVLQCLYVAVTRPRSYLIWSCNMSLKSLIDKALSKQPLAKPSRIKKQRNASEAIEQERVIKWARDK